MKNLHWLVILLISYSCNNGQPKIAINNQEKRKKDISKIQSDLIFENTKVFPNNTQLSIAIIENGQPHFYGIIRENDTISNLKNEFKNFEIGSITKTFTSTLLSGLAIENKIGLDDNINEYLKFQLKDNQKITFKQLANHTSGLPIVPPNYDLENKKSISNHFKNYDEQNLKEYLTQSMDLGEREMGYSNLGAAILAYTLCKVEHTSYNTLLQKRIFSKYNMENSTTIRSEVDNQLIKGLDENGHETPNWDMDIYVGAGGILSTTADLSKFAIAQFDSANIELALTRKVTQVVDENEDVGLGWGIIKNKSENNWYGHYGATGGYSSAITIDPINQTGVIILSNVSYLNKNMMNIFLLNTELMKTLGR